MSQADLDRMIQRSLALGLKLSERSVELGYNEMELALACHWTAQFCFERTPPLRTLAELLDERAAAGAAAGKAIVEAALSGQ